MCSLGSSLQFLNHVVGRFFVRRHAVIPDLNFSKPVSSPVETNDIHTKLIQYERTSCAVQFWIYRDVHFSD